MQKTRSSRRAFTLLELLVVLVIVAILVALLFPVAGVVRAAMDRTKCLSNLRQIGSAMSLYTADHDGSLPGPLWKWQSSWYQDGDYGALGTVLAPYLNLHLGELRKAEPLVCPAWDRGNFYRKDEAFVMNTEVDSDGERLNPWGSAHAAKRTGGRPGSDPNGEDIPRKLVALTGFSLTQTWAMQDLDQLYDGPLPPKKEGIALTPVHGDVRNVLFFDFHVAAVPARKDLRR